MRKVFGIKVDEFAEATIFSLAWTAGLTSAYVAYYGKEQIFLATAIFLFFSSVGMYYFLKLEAYQKVKRQQSKQSGEEGGKAPQGENVKPSDTEDGSVTTSINS